MYELDIVEIDYLVREGVSLRARLYIPRGDGPFPAYVDAHGGAWVKGSYAGNDPINRIVAAGGVVIMAVGYTLPPNGTYPASVADLNYAVRWLKLNAAQYKTRPAMVGLMGTSAGGHLAVLAGIKPRDKRYAALPLIGGERINASVSSIIALWPVICPYTRMIENKERQARGDTSMAHRNGGGFAQMAYWLTDEAMIDGSPMLALERGDKVETPDILYIQAVGDVLHAVHNMDRFIAGYRRAGGSVETELLEGDEHDQLRSDPGRTSSRHAFDHIIRFAHGQRRKEASAA